MSEKLTADDFKYRGIYKGFRIEVDELIVLGRSMWRVYSNHSVNAGMDKGGWVETMGKGIRMAKEYIDGLGEVETATVFYRGFEIYLTFDEDEQHWEWVVYVRDGSERSGILTMSSDRDYLDALNEAKRNIDEEFNYE